MAWIIFAIIVIYLLYRLFRVKITVVPAESETDIYCPKCGKNLSREAGAVSGLMTRAVIKKLMKEALARGAEITCYLCGHQFHVEGPDGKIIYS